MNLKLRTLQDSLNENESDVYGSTSEIDTDTVAPRPISPPKKATQELIQEPPKLGEPKDVVMKDVVQIPINQVSAQDFN